MTSKAPKTFYVAFLRGINIGGRQRLPMLDLALLFIEAGCSHVSTYVQSGNVTFKADAALAQVLPGLISRRIDAAFKMKVPVILRSAEQLKKVMTKHPFGDRGVDHDALHVVFLSEPPHASELPKLDPDYAAPDRFQVQGNEIFVYCHPGPQRSRLTNHYFNTKLKDPSTMRNWRTLHALLERMKG